MCFSAHFEEKLRIVHVDFFHFLNRPLHTNIIKTELQLQQNICDVCFEFDTFITHCLVYFDQLPSTDNRIPYHCPMLQYLKVLDLWHLFTHGIVYNMWTDQVEWVTSALAWTRLSFRYKDYKEDTCTMWLSGTENATCANYVKLNYMIKQ